MTCQRCNKPIDDDDLFCGPCSIAVMMRMAEDEDEDARSFARLRWAMLWVIVAVIILALVIMSMVANSGN